MTQRSRTVMIHPSFRAEALQTRRISSLHASAIDPAFHYAGVRQADLWLRVHQTHAPGSVDPDFERIYRTVADDLARSLAGQSVHVIGLGAGGGEKEAWILEALDQSGCRLRYTPVDISPELALLSAEVAESRVRCPTFPVVGDLSLLADTRDWLNGDDSEEPRVFTAFGLTPNFPPATLFPLLAHALRQQDRLLISANLAPATTDDENEYQRACYALIGQYDNAETREWLRQVLIDWGIAALLSEPAFELDEMEGIAGFFATSRWLADTQFELDGQRFSAARGDRLRVFYSLRFTRRRLLEKLGEYGLRMGAGCTATNGQEGVYPAWLPD